MTGSNFVEKVPLEELSTPEEYMAVAACKEEDEESLVVDSSEEGEAGPTEETPLIAK
jgi:hypothetical protein